MLAPPKNKEESIRCSGFIPPPQPAPGAEDNSFEGEPVLMTEIDVEENHCPSKVKKLGTNPNTSNLIRKNLVRSRIQRRACFKYRAIYAFSALSKEEKVQLQEFIGVHTCQCGYPLFPNNNIEFTDLSFGANTLETNHKLTCSDKIESQMDHIFPACTHCGKEELAADMPKGYRPMRTECLKTKELVVKGWKKVDKEAAIKRAISNVEVKRKRQTTLEFTTITKTKKIKVEQCEIASVNDKKEHQGNGNNKGDAEVEEVSSRPSNKAPIIEDECNALLEEAIRMLGLAKHDVAGLGDCQLLAICLAYFGRRRYDESDRSKSIIDFKRSMINACHHQLGNDSALEGRCSFWRKHMIGDMLSSECCMNDVALSQLCTVLNHKICAFCKPRNEEHQLGEICMPIDGKVGKLKRYGLLFKDNEFIISHFNGKKKGDEIEGSLSDWMNEGSISFMWHKGLHYQSYLTKADERFYQSRSFPKLSPIPENICPWKCKINSACPVCQKTWSDDSVYCYLCDGCAHYKCIGNEFYKKHKKPADFKNKTFICYHCMDNIKMHLETYHESLNKNKPLRLMESIDWFFSFLKIKFSDDNVDLCKRILQYKQIDRRVSQVR